MDHERERWVGEVVPKEVSDAARRVTTSANFAEALSASRKLLAPLFNAVPELIVVLEVGGGDEFRFLTVNQAYLDFTGLTSDDLLGKRLEEVFPDVVAEFVLEKCIQASSTKEPLRYEQTLRRKGSSIVLDATASPIVNAEGNCTHLLWVARDISAMKEAEEQLRRRSAVLRLLHSASAAANRTNTIEEAARLVLYEVCTHTGWPVGHLYTVIDEQGTLFPTPVWHLEDPKKFSPLRRMTEIGNVDHARGLAGWVRLSGKPKLIKDVSTNPHFERAQVAGKLDLKGAYAFPVLVGRKVVAVLEFFSRQPAQEDAPLFEVMDLIGDQLSRVVERTTTRKELEETLKKIRTLSLSDELTGISNRRGFITLSSFQIKFAKRNDRKLVLLFVDLDNMKQINDEFGHLNGDRALQDLTNLLVQTFRDSDIIARVGGDEFCVLLSASEADAGNSIARLDDVLDKHNESGKRPFKLAISIGVAVFDPKDPVSIEELIDRADAAMYKVKTEKRELTGA